MKAILTYHSIDASGSPISVDPSVFRAHHRWLASGTVRVLPLDDLVRQRSDGQDAVAVTFDDGFLSAREPTEMLLADGVPVTIFAVTGQVGGANNWGGQDAPGIPTMPLFGWDDLERLTSHGASVAAHTRTHPCLTALSALELDDELLGAREDLKRRLGVETTHLAYPYGDVDERIAALAGRHYQWGYTTEFRPLMDREAPLRLPRLDMYYFRTSGALEGWGTARFARRLAWCQTRRALRALAVRAFTVGRTV